MSFRSLIRVRYWTQRNDLPSLWLVCSCAALMLMLTGCPSASTPTRAPSTPAPPVPPPSGASGSSTPSSSSVPSGARSPSTPGGASAGGSSASAGTSGDGGASPAGRAGGSGGGDSTQAANGNTSGAGQTSGGNRDGDLYGQGTGGDGIDPSSSSPEQTGQGEPGVQGGDPGFQTSVGVDAGLPSMVDVLPTFDAPGSGGMASGDDAVASNSGSSGDETGTNGDAGGSNAASGTGSDSGIGTRATGGVDEGFEGMGTMTAAEQVAILDRRLETSTGDFDALILEEQRRQRSRDRGKSPPTTEQSGSAESDVVSPRSPYENSIDGDSVGGGMGGIARAGAPPQNPAVYEPPGDIPLGSDDDVVARQLREAAMREPDPDIREKLWNEYRRYKGIDIPVEQ